MNVSISNNTLRVLSQFSAREKVTLMVGLGIRRYKNWSLDRIKALRPEFNVCGLYYLYYHYLTERGYKLQKEGDGNVVDLKNTSNECLKVFLRRMTSDYDVFEQVLINEEYKPLTDLVRDWVDPQDIEYVIDAGGNIGLTTLYLTRAFPKASVITMEPAERNYNAMLKNFALNNLSRVHPIRAGLWHKNEALTLDYTFGDKREWAIAVKPAAQSQAKAHYTVPGMTLKKVMQQFDFPRIDVLKIDIEGAEQYLFENPKDMAEILRKVRFIAIEVHGELNIKGSIVSQLEGAGFALREVSETLIGINTTLH